jgi:hypothetical protein
MPRPADTDDPLADLVAVGRVIPASGRGGSLPTPVTAPAGTPSVTEALLAERHADQR